jgi:acyl-coenzyme A synthetase/AMP-(fatty) acid ligase
MTYQEFYQSSIQNPEQFWREQAQSLDWFEFPKEILSKDEDDLYRWYKGGKMNTAYLALDYHVKNGRGDQTALIYDSPVTNTVTQYTYSELLSEVERVAGMLMSLGVKKGDRVIIYMPMIPETAFAMLACARLGAVHSVVFGGFAANELAIRIDDSTPDVLLTASAGIEIKKVIPYKPIVDQAIEMASHKVKHVVMLQREVLRADMQEGRDIDWMTLRARSKPATYVEVDATDPLYILYTSGTTGVPKGVVRDNGGHAVAMKFSMEYIYGIKPGEVYWAASDVGWVVGHSYIIYAPLLHGCTTILFEGKPIKTPDAGTFWRVIEDYGVNVFFTAPTAFRAIIKEDPEGKMHEKYNTASLRLQFLAGERCDVTTLHWLEDLLKIPVIDHWWQTESGWPMLANMAGVELLPVKPGSACKAVCGYDIRVLNENGEEVAANEEGIVAIKYPLPPGCLPNLWQDTARFKGSYLTTFPGYYFAGDGGYRDEDGYVFITGRIDDIINVAGHRLSTAEMEEVVASHEAVAECSVIGIADQLKGQVPVGFVVLKAGVNPGNGELEKELISMVRAKIGPVAAFKRAVIVERLPKTRSGKILRKIMRAIADGDKFNPPSTIEDMSVLGELEAKMEQEKVGQAF